MAILIGRVLLSGPERLLERYTLYQIVGNTGKHILLWVATRPASHSACKLTSVFWEKAKGKTDTIHSIIVESIWHVPEYRLPDEIETKLLGEEQSILEESENFWIEYHHPNSKETLSNLVGIGPETQGNTDRPPAALILVRPDLYIAQSTLVQTESDIDRALSFLKTYVK
ncbi:hypothetical protein K501DRAFT_329075 [Backusella circina FSU 941]|nr:hypothetical protein K501DRAFT_329075 [Backusella circina FSU 941]